MAVRESLMIAADIQIEALFLRIIRLLTEMPFADARAQITLRVKHLRERDFLKRQMVDFLRDDETTRRFGK